MTATSLAGRLCRRREQHRGQFVGHVLLRHMRAGQGVHGPARLVPELLVELRERRRRRHVAIDVGLALDPVDAAGQRDALGETRRRLRRRLALKEIPHFLARLAEGLGRQRRREIVFRGGDRRPVGARRVLRHEAEQRLSVLRYEGVEIDQRRDLVGNLVGHAAHDHAAIGMADQNDLAEILIVDNAEHVLDMRVEVDAAIDQMLALADAGQGRAQHIVPRLAQPLLDRFPDNASRPRAMNQYEGRHHALPAINPYCRSIAPPRNNRFNRPASRQSERGTAMGMLIDGKWNDAATDTKGKTGSFDRTAATFRHKVTADGSSGFKAEAGRYHLFLAFGCPWCHRVMLFLKLKKLEGVISSSYTHHAPGIGGWRFETPDKLFGAKFAYDVYLKDNPKF